MTPPAGTYGPLSTQGRGAQLLRLQGQIANLGARMAPNAGTKGAFWALQPPQIPDRWFFGARLRQAGLRSGGSEQDGLQPIGQ
jgi:hypothetical protein